MVDSLPSIHARVAALVRHRSPNDPELLAARQELAACRRETVAHRVLDEMSPNDRARVLAAYSPAPEMASA